MSENAGATIRDIEIEAPIEVSRPWLRRHALDEIGSIMRLCSVAEQTTPASFHVFRQPTSLHRNLFPRQFAFRGFVQGTLRMSLDRHSVVPVLSPA